MKKHSIYIVCLCCILFYACGNEDRQEPPEIGKLGGITPPVITKDVSEKATPTVAIKTETTKNPIEENEDHIVDTTSIPKEPEGEITEVITVTPMISEEATPTVTITPLVVEEKITSSPIPTAAPQTFFLDELGLESYEDELGREIYETATSFFDENGLMCVQLKAICEMENDRYEVEKCYYLPSGIVYREKENVSETELFELFEGHITKETYVTKAYEPVVFETVSNSVWTTEGQMKKASEMVGESYKSKFSCTPKDGYIPVKEGEKFRITFYFAATPKIAGILFMDANERVVEFLSFNSTTQLNEQVIVVPKGAAKMHVSLFANQKYRVERRIELVGADLSGITEEAYIEQSLETMLTIPRKSKEQYLLDKAYITFVLDDCRPDMDKIIDIFEEYKIPLCIAAVHENLLFSVSGGNETRREVCERVVRNGGEVLSHDVDVITEDMLGDYCILTEQFFEDKWILQQMGFDINGIILAGGNGQLVGHPATDLFARTFYQYSDLYGEQASGEPYYHRRYWLGNCLDTYDEVIDKAVEQKKWIVLYLHDLKEVNAEKLHEILQYATSLSEEDAEIVTYKTLYDKMW